jgi:hypothetical protein
MIRRPCLCHDGYMCTQHYPAKTRQRMVDNKLAALAKDFDIDDGQWCCLMYLHEIDDLDFLLFEGEAS